MSPEAGPGASPLTVTLHIGATKTGSSALQQLLHANRAALARAGVIYPDTGIAAGAHHLLLGAIHPGAWKMHEDAYDRPPREYFDRGMREILAEAGRTGAEHVVLSSEYLWGVYGPGPYRALRAALQGTRIRLFACLRDPAPWAEATYLQALKAGTKLDYEAWLEKFAPIPARGFDFGRVIDGWARALQAERTVLMRYAFADPQRFMARVFATLTGVELVGMPESPARSTVNPSPTRRGAALILELNRQDLAPGIREARLREILAGHSRPPNSGALFFPALSTRLGVSAPGPAGAGRQPGAETAPHPGLSAMPLWLNAAGSVLSPARLCAQSARGGQKSLQDHFGAENCTYRQDGPVLGRACFLAAAPGAGRRRIARALAGTGAFSPAREAFRPGFVISRSRINGIATLPDYLRWLEGEGRSQAGGASDAILLEAVSADQILMLHRFAIARMFLSVSWVFLKCHDVIGQAVSHFIDTSLQKGPGKPVALADVEYDFSVISSMLRSISIENAAIEQAFSITNWQYDLAYTNNYGAESEVRLWDIQDICGVGAGETPALKRKAGYARLVETFAARYRHDLGSAAAGAGGAPAGPIA